MYRCMGQGLVNLGQNLKTKASTLDLEGKAIGHEAKA